MPLDDGRQSKWMPMLSNSAMLPSATVPTIRVDRSRKFVEGGRPRLMTVSGVIIPLTVQMGPGLQKTPEAIHLGPRQVWARPVYGVVQARYDRGRRNLEPWVSNRVVTSCRWEVYGVTSLSVCKLEWICHLLATCRAIHTTRNWRCAGSICTDLNVVLVCLQAHILSCFVVCWHGKRHG